MPTPGGKPRAGEYVRNAQGKKIYYVLERLSGDVMYSVRVQDPDNNVKIITEFPFWMRERKWTVGP